MDPPNEQGMYTRMLMLKRQGYPLWAPFVQIGPPSTWTVGVRIGDVGHVNENGSFLPLFNTRAAHDHPINFRGVPGGFSPVEIPIAFQPQYYAPKTFMLSGIVRNDTRPSLLPNDSSPALTAIVFFHVGI